MGWPKCHFGLNGFHFIRIGFLFFSLLEEVDLTTGIILALDIFRLVEMLFSGHKQIYQGVYNVLCVL
jgi:hypothetical protein